MNEWEWFACFAASGIGAVTFLKFVADSVTMVQNSLGPYERREKKRFDRQNSLGSASGGRDNDIITITGNGVANPA